MKCWNVQFNVCGNFNRARQIPLIWKKMLNANISWKKLFLFEGSPFVDYKLSFQVNNIDRTILFLYWMKVRCNLFTLRSIFCSLSLPKDLFFLYLCSSGYKIKGWNKGLQFQNYLSYVAAVEILIDR